MLSDADIMAQVLAAFQEEQVEHRQAITDLLLALERAPDPSASTPAITQLFREAHSLKGGARAAGRRRPDPSAGQWPPGQRRAGRTSRA